MKRIVVSGGSRGIGRAIALRFAREEFAVALFSRRKEELEKIKGELEAAGAAQLIIRQADASRPDEIRSFAETVLEAWSGCDVLVNNVGIFEPENILNASEGALERMMQVNLYASYNLTRYLVNAMPKNGKSYIFNICSTASLKAYPGGNLYAISKHALLGFSRGLREELKGKLRISSIMPGAVLTDSWAETELPPERFMPAKDIADVLWQFYECSSRTVVEEIVLRPLSGDI